MTSATLPPPARNAVWTALLSTAALALWIAAVDWIAPRDYAGALTALGMLTLPLGLRQLVSFEGDPLGMTDASLPQSVVGAALSVCLITAPFLLVYDQLAVTLWEKERFAGAGLLSPGLDLQGVPPPSRSIVQLHERGRGVTLHNGLDVAIVVKTLSPEAQTSTVRAGGWLDLPRQRHHEVQLQTAQGPLAAEKIALGGGGVSTPSSTVNLRASPWWILWLIMVQLVMIALPEEVFFRGWILRQLRQKFTPRRQVLGVPFGVAHLISALLFASVHLVLTPSPSRLAVFFPGLLFAWLAERFRGVGAAALCHAGCNVLLLLTSRMYL